MRTARYIYGTLIVFFLVAFSEGTLLTSDWSKTARVMLIVILAIVYCATFVIHAEIDANNPELHKPPAKK